MIAGWKTCSQCSEEKLLSDFYNSGRHHTTRCKPCHNIYMRNWRRENKDAIRIRDRERGFCEKERHRRRQYYQTRKHDPDFRSRKQALCKEAELRHPIKYRTRTILTNAKKYGKVIPNEMCENCGMSEDVTAHHEDYTKPLDVIWLCRACHGKRHQEINDLIRNGEDWSEKGF